MKLWTYSNLYRDQLQHNKGHGKEICDEAIFFDKDVILFSDKECEFPDINDVLVGWKRWYKKTVKKSADQLFGAERWIRHYPERIFLDRSCTNKLPIKRPDPTDTVFHRVAVASGAGQACREFFGDGSGSLMLAPVVGTGRRPGYEEEMSELPFVVGQVDPRGFVHVFDDVGLELVLSTLDTISDFIEYLDWKESFVSMPNFGFSAGEEELLALFIRHRMGQLSLDNLEFTESYLISIPEGWWNELQNDRQYMALREAQKISYMWDYIIDDFAEDVLAGRMSDVSRLGHWQRVTPDIHERRLRGLARPSRAARLVLSHALMDFMKTELQGSTHTVRAIIPKRLADSGYVFLRYPYIGETWLNYRDYRTERQASLSAHVMCFKLQHPHLLHVVGIASEFTEGRSHDIIYLSDDEWDRTAIDVARALQEELGLFKGQMKEFNVLDEIGIELFEGREQKPQKPKQRAKRRKKRQEQRKARRKNRK